MIKDEILNGLEWLDNLPPSKWNPAIVLRIKHGLIPKIKDYVNATGQFFGDLEESQNQYDIAKEVFETKSEPVTSVKEDLV